MSLLPSRRAVLGAGALSMMVRPAAAPEIASPASGGAVLECARHVRALSRAANAADRAWLASQGHPDREALYERLAELTAEAGEEADAMLLMPAATAGDILAQAQVLLDLGDRLTGHVTHAEQVETADLIKVGAASIVRWALNASRVDPDSVGFAGLNAVLRSTEKTRQRLLEQRGES